MSNPTGLQRHMHRNDTGLVRCHPVLSSRQRKLEVEGAEFGLFDHDTTTSVDDDLHGMRRCTGLARTFSRHSQQRAEMRACSLGRRRRAFASCDGKCTGDTKSCCRLPHPGHSFLFPASSLFMTSRPACWFDRPESACCGRGYTGDGQSKTFGFRKQDVRPQP